MKFSAGILVSAIFLIAPYALAGSASDNRDAVARVAAVGEPSQDGVITAEIRRRRKIVHKRKLWYWTATPPASGAQPIYVGPYPNLWDCRDMLGSALYSHPFACHITGPNPPSNCRITGNGFAYPKDYPFPVPSDMMIASADCVASDDPALRLKAGWYFLYYTVNGGGVASCKEYKEYKELATITPGMELGCYRNKLCPGAPCFSVGFDTACN